MADNLINIGVLGGYASGKATFLNALFKAPCFEMKSHTHNNTIIEIKESKTPQMSWFRSVWSLFSKLRFLHWMFFDWKKSTLFFTKISNISGKIKEDIVFPDFPPDSRRFAPGSPALHRCGWFIVQNALEETTIEGYIKRI